MFDEDNPVRKFKYALMTGLMFLVSIYFSWQEFVYLIRGKMAVGNVTDTYQQSSGRFGTNKNRVLEYSFREDGGLSRCGADMIGIDEPIPAQVNIQYTPGENGRSRLEGHVRWYWLAFFFGSIVLLGIALYRLNKQIDEAMAPRKRR
jgi:hypothetical protein